MCRNKVDVQESIDPTVKKVKVVIDSNPSDSVIYVIDGVQVKKIKDIDPDNIESVSVMKEDNLVVITTKNKAGKQGLP